MTTQLKSTVPAIPRRTLDTYIEQGLWPAPAGNAEGVDFWTEQQILEALALLIAISNGSSQPGLLKNVQ